VPQRQDCKSRLIHINGEPPLGSCCPRHPRKMS
jgi:hypothetical protein